MVDRSKPRYRSQRGADFLNAIKHHRRKGFRLIRDRLNYSRPVPWITSKREIKRGRDITCYLRGMPAPEWVMQQWPGSSTFIEVRGHGTRDGQPQEKTRYYVLSLCTGAKARIKAIRQRWLIENSWHWVRDMPPRERRPPLPGGLSEGSNNPRHHAAPVSCLGLTE